MALRLSSSTSIPSVTINDGGTLYVNMTNSDTVHFAGGTGRLVLADPANFHGKITGFSGTAPDAAHSDVIQVAGYDFLDPDFQAHYYSATGILTIQDAIKTALWLTFDDFSGNIVFASDGHGGTLIFDPPSGPANIAAGQLLEIASADDSLVTFTGGNGDAAARRSLHLHRHDCPDIGNRKCPGSPGLRGGDHDGDDRQRQLSRRHQYHDADGD